MLFNYRRICIDAIVCADPPENILWISSCSHAYTLLCLLSPLKAVYILVLFHSCPRCTDKKENQIFLIYKEIQRGAVAKSYMTNGLLIYGEILAHFLIYPRRCTFKECKH
jgi:hypothetical protein